MNPIESWHEEKQSAWLYRSLSACERDPRMAGLFAKLAEAAESQAVHWAALAQKDGRPVPPGFQPQPRARLVAALARKFGPRRVKPALAALKVRGLSAYSTVMTGHPLPTTLDQIGAGHRTVGGGNLRAAIFGVNDGLVSNASLILGMVGANASTSTVLATGIAGLLAGALSMAAGEYVSVSSQADTEQADLRRERRELAEDGEHEKKELAAIYILRGLDPLLAGQVAEQLMKHDALGAHARDELGISETGSARPVQAALTSAATFAVGAVLPLLIVLLAPDTDLIVPVSSASLLFLTLLGMLAAYSGGASIMKGAFRVAFWGALAMGLTAAVGSAFGTVV